LRFPKPTTTTTTTTTNIGIAGRTRRRRHMCPQRKNVSNWRGQKSYVYTRCVGRERVSVVYVYKIERTFPPPVLISRDDAATIDIDGEGGGGGH
jgi:hypothetical protein